MDAALVIKVKIKSKKSVLEKLYPAKEAIELSDTFPKNPNRNVRSKPDIDNIFHPSFKLSKLIPPSNNNLCKACNVHAIFVPLCFIYSVPQAAYR